VNRYIGDVPKDNYSPPAHTIPNISITDYIYKTQVFRLIVKPFNKKRHILYFQQQFAHFDDRKIM